jgi:phospho-N-acetylmuramoyl-pentapeptide-transferase
VLYLLYDLWRGSPVGPYAYKDPLFRATCAILLGFLFVWFIGPKIIRQLALRKIGDNPEFDHSRLNEYLKDKKNTPTMGGIIILAAITFCTLLLSDLRNYYVIMGLFCMVWLGILGGIDDWLKLTVGRRSGSRDGLKMYEKLLFQIGLGVLLGIFVYRYGQDNSAFASFRGVEDMPSFRILIVPFYKPGILLGIPAFLFLTVIVTTGTSNAVNLTDGMDGLAAGCMVLCSFVFMVLSFVVGSTPDQAHQLLFPYIPDTAELAILCGAVMGACLGFLWYNCHPAQVFMGDTGSLPLGGLMGYVAIVTRQELMLFIVGGIFVIEAVSVIIQIFYFKTTGKRFFRVAPIHHHFHLGGWTETQTVTRFWLLSVIFAGIALVTIRVR